MAGDRANEMQSLLLCHSLSAKIITHLTFKQRLYGMIRLILTFLLGSIDCCCNAFEKHTNVSVSREHLWVFIYLKVSILLHSRKPALLTVLWFIVLSKQATSPPNLVIESRCLVTTTRYRASSASHFWFEFLCHLFDISCIGKPQVWIGNCSSSLAEGKQSSRDSCWAGQYL